MYPDMQGQGLVPRALTGVFPTLFEVVGSGQVRQLSTAPELRHVAQEMLQTLHVY
jgi:hypothetical protein